MVPRLDLGLQRLLQPSRRRVIQFCVHSGVSSASSLVPRVSLSPSSPVAVFPRLRLRLSPSSPVFYFVYLRLRPSPTSSISVFVRLRRNARWLVQRVSAIKSDVLYRGSGSHRGERVLSVCGELLVKRPLLCCDVLP